VTREVVGVFVRFSCANHLFYKKYQTSDEFKFISGTKGQVWSLFEQEGTLLCGHDSRGLCSENAIAKNIFSASGTWKFETVPNQGGYYFKGIIMDFQCFRK
jgi:hypothetical protein